MDVSLMELARTRWQAAAAASMILDAGGDTPLKVDRAQLTMVKPGTPPVLTPATTAASWSTVVGIIVDVGQETKDPTRTRRVLVDPSAVVAMEIKD